MTLKQFQASKIIVAIILASVVAQAVILNNYILAGAGVVISIILITIFKHQVKEVMVDERDNEIAGRAARYSLTGFAIAASIVTFIFLSLRRANPAYEIIGSVLAYATCGLLFIYSAIFNYLLKRPRSKK